MSTVTSLEVEAKLSASAELEAPDLTHIPGIARAEQTVVHHLSAVYYDTADLRLTRAAVTLRRRTGGKDDGWHIKLPARGGSGGRTEIRAAIDPERPETPPEAILAEVWAMSRGGELSPIAQVDNERHETVYLTAAGAPAIEFCDDHVTAESFLPGGTRRSWREWEVELCEAPAEHGDAVDSGDSPSDSGSASPSGVELLHQAVAQLRTAGAHPADSPSKLVSALGDSIANAPLPPQVATLPANSAAAGVITALAASRDRIVEMDPQVRRDEWDSIHQMRVATRKLRSHMRTFEGIVAGERYSHVEKELKLLAGILGVARDAEVVRERIAALIASEDSGAIDESTATQLLDALRADYTRAHARVVRVLESQRYLTLLTDLDELISNPPLAETTESHSSVEHGADEAAAAILAEHLEAAYRSLVRRHERAQRRWEEPGLTLDQRLDEFHAVRKAAKKLRYSAEAAGAATSLKSKKLAAACSEMQSVLGDVQDTVTSRQLVQRRARRAHAHGQDTFGYGVLYQLERERGDRALESYTQAFERVERGYAQMMAKAEKAARKAKKKTKKKGKKRT